MVQCIFGFRRRQVNIVIKKIIDTHFFLNSLFLVLFCYIIFTQGFSNNITAQCNNHSINFRYVMLVLIFLLCGFYCHVKRFVLRKLILIYYFEKYFVRLLLYKKISVFLGCVCDGSFRRKLHFKKGKLFQRYSFGKYLFLLDNDYIKKIPCSRIVCLWFIHTQIAF